MWPWWIIYFLVPVFVGVVVTEYKSDIFRLLKAAFVHGFVQLLVVLHVDLKRVALIAESAPFWAS